MGWGTNQSGLPSVTVTNFYFCVYVSDNLQNDTRQYMTIFEPRRWEKGLKQAPPSYSIQVLL